MENDDFAGIPNPNSGLVELEMLLEIVNNSPASSLEVFFSYFPYGMQDKIFQEGETKAAENLIKKLAEYYKAKKIYAIDAHFHGQDWINKYPFTNISAVDLLKKAAQKDYPDIVFMTPDTGGRRRTGLDGTKKKRLHSYHIEINHDETFENMVKGKTIGVVDDILETGGTLERFYDHCQECGAKNTLALITHGVLPAGMQKIRSKYTKLYLTNTIDRNEANVDVTDKIVANLHE